MKVWTVGNLKGGVGKTTSTVSLGGLNALRGERVLLVDLDPQGSLTQYFGLDLDIEQGNVARLFSDDMCHADKFELIQPTRFENIYLIPSSSRLSAVERKFSTLSGKGLFLSQYLKKFAHNFDHVYIDCPPFLGLLLINALAACDHLIIPVQPEFLAVKGLERMIHTIKMIELSRNIHIDYTIVPTMYDHRLKAARSGLGELKLRFRSSVWHKYIPVDTQLREASRHNIPIGHYALKSKSAQAFLKLLHYLNMQTFYEVSQFDREADRNGEPARVNNRLS